jgi:hypothetical protein
MISFSLYLVCMAQNIFFKLLFNFPFAKFYIKFLFRLAGAVVGQSSHSLRSHITLKLRPYVTFGSEMK